MDFDRAEIMLGSLAEIIDLPAYNDSDRLTLSRTLAITSLHFAASVRTLCQAELALGAAVILRSQFEALVRSVWGLHRATDTQIEKLSAALTIESQQASKNIPLTTEMLAELEKLPQLHGLLVSLKEFKDSSWQPLNSFVHAGIHAVHWTNFPIPASLIETIFKTSNGLAVLTFQHLAIITGRPTLQRDVIAACASFSSCLPPHR